MLIRMLKRCWDRFNIAQYSFPFNKSPNSKTIVTVDSYFSEEVP
jgi:hypothetical protein